MQNATSLKQVFQGLGPRGATIIRGRVISVSPLKIQDESDEKLILGPQVLFVPEHLTDHTAVIVMPDGGDGSMDTLVTVKRGLKSGELVYLLALIEKKQYFVLGRVG